MIRIIATVVFVLFGLFAGVATSELGLAPYGPIAAILVTGGLLWEIWIQPARDEAYRDIILADIENLKERSFSPGNLRDARDYVTHLGEQLDIVTDAYVELKEDKEECDVNTP